MTLEEAKTLAEFYNQCKILSEETRQKISKAKPFSVFLWCFEKSVEKTVLVSLSFA